MENKINLLHVSHERGLTSLMVIAFMGIFLMLFSGLMGFAVQKSKYSRAITDREAAFHIAEDGLEYYRWFLAHFPNNVTNGTGQPGPYVRDSYDPVTGLKLGSASIAVTPAYQCGVIQYIDIASTGSSVNQPNFTRKISARYIHPSVANYSFLLNSNVWSGANKNISGPYFSNGGIRMDSTSNSDVSSAVSTWSCDSSFGCSPTATQNGVWGAGTSSALWHFPVSSVDFTGITSSLSNLKTYAQTQGGTYIAPASTSTINMSSRGYHLIFKSNGTFDVYKVSATTPVPSMTVANVWITDYNIIATESYVGNYSISSTCGVIFVEDRVWVEGTVNGRVTVAAADFTNVSYKPDAILSGNILYNDYIGNSGLTIIASGNVLIPLNSPDSMEVHGVFVAQSGSAGRNFYTSNAAYGSNAVSSAWAPYVTRATLIIDGSTVSNLRTGTSWSCSGVFCSGYANRINAYDQLQATTPPPFTPAASTNYGFVLWSEL